MRRTIALLAVLALLLAPAVPAAAAPDQGSGPALAWAGLDTLWTWVLDLVGLDAAETDRAPIATYSESTASAGPIDDGATTSSCDPLDACADRGPGGDPDG